MSKKFHLIIIAIIFVLFVIVLFVSAYILDHRTHEIKKQIFSNTYLNVHKDVELLIKTKKEATLSIALALSSDKYMIEALKANNHKILELDKLSNTLNKFTRFKNVWFQIIDINGKNFYRSWSNQRGDLVYKSRIDIQKMLKIPKVTSSISVGKYDMTFKSMVPIYDVGGEFLGIFEIITHFNSISKKLKTNKFNSIVIAHKKYKNQLTRPFTKTFIDDYYVANLDANNTIMNIIKQKGIENYLEIKERYFIDENNNYFVTVYRIPDLNNKPMGYIILFKDLNDIPMEDLKNTTKNIIFTVFIILVFISIMGYYISNKKYNEILTEDLDHTKKQKDKINAILSAQPYIIIILYKNNSLDVNDKFFEFFDKYKTLKEFKKDNNCICNFFIKPDSDDGTYLENDVNWIDKILQNPQKELKAAMYKDDELKHFIVRASKPSFDDELEQFTILTFIDVTELKRKDDLLFQQSKNASMGEMIANIAHQWRQPLSIISTAATGILVQKQFGELTDEVIEKTCNNINDNAQYLSKTIDDFRNFMKGDSYKEEFEMGDFMNRFLHLIEPVVKSNDIKLITNINEELKLKGYPNELLQCFINIFNNSKDAFIETNLKKRVVFIRVFKSKNKVKIIFRDNAGGIDNSFITKIFEPYFTTKHQSQGTGLGLHMTYNLITAHMEGTLYVSNDTYKYNNKEYKGAQFIVSLPL